MKAFYYPLLLKQPLVKMPNGMASRFYIIYFLLSLIWLGQTAKAQFGSDLGPSQISTLQWNDISSSMIAKASIGLTTDGRVYTWGDNFLFTIKTQGPHANIQNVQAQVAPHYIPLNQQIIKVRAKGSSIGGLYGATYFALATNGNLYAWGVNTGLLTTAWPTIPIGSSPTFSDSTKVRRVPVQLTIQGETSFVDFDASDLANFWVAVSATGKAYHIGASGGGTEATTFAALPNPSGVDASFKYTNVWVSDVLNTLHIFLKGNNGKIYFTGRMSEAYNSGISAIASSTPTPTPTNAELLSKVREIIPREVPFPSGEDIVRIVPAVDLSYGNSSFAFSASGKAYIAGLWRVIKTGGSPSTQYVIAPLKSSPSASDIYSVRGSTVSDTSYSLRSFKEIAMLPGATAIKDIVTGGGVTTGHLTLAVGDNGKAYFSGSILQAPARLHWAGDLVKALRTEPNTLDMCRDNIYTYVNSFYTWDVPAPMYDNAVKFYNTDNSAENFNQLAIISKSGRGYFTGRIFENAGIGRTVNTTNGTIRIPVPIANELLYDCNPSPGTGGPLGEPVSTPGVGVIDCSKTKLYPAPVQGTPSELSLLVTINVTTIGDFSPITISGSGMSLVSGFDKVTATTTGVQTFHIPIKYNGSTLTNNFQFTIGSAGSCSADLTNKPSNEITKVWSLNNCTAITPGVLSK